MLNSGKIKEYIIHIYIMPIASKNFVEAELKRTNQTLGLDLVLGKNGNGYTLYTNQTRTSEINCCMTFREVTTTLATMRRMFDYRELQNLIFDKIQNNKQDLIRQQLASFRGN